MIADGQAMSDVTGALPVLAAPTVPTAPTAQTDKLNVFISYSRADLVFADELFAGLEVMGFDPRLDRHAIVEGEDWKKRLGGLIADADTVVFVISPDSARSDICKWEIDEASRLSKRILPVMWRPTGAIPVPAKLAALNYVRFDANEDGKARSFMAGLKALSSALNTDLDWIREHTRLLARAMEWDGGGRAANRLLSGDDIVKAKTWIAQRPRNAPEPTPLHFDFVKASEGWEAEQLNERQRQLAEREKLLAESERAQQREAAAQAERDAQARRVVQRTLMGVAASVVLALVAAGFAVWALGLRQEAGELRLAAAGLTREAAGLKRDANEFRKQGLLLRSQYLAGLAADETAKGDAGTGLLLALEALPDADSDDEETRTRPYWWAAEVSLEAARRRLREKGLLKGHTRAVTSVAETPDGARSVTGSDDNTAMEAIAWLDLQPGVYRMVVNSDDNFRVSVAPDPP